MNDGSTCENNSINDMTANNKNAYPIIPFEHSVLSNPSPNNPPTNVLVTPLYNPSNNLPNSPQSESISLYDENGNFIQERHSIEIKHGVDRFSSARNKYMYKKLIKIQAVALTIGILWSLINRLCVHLITLDTDQKQETIGKILKYQLVSWGVFSLGALYLVCSLVWYYVICRKSKIGSCAYCFLSVLCSAHYAAWLIWVICVDGILINIYL